MYVYKNIITLIKETSYSRIYTKLKIISLYLIALISIVIINIAIKFA